MKVYKSKRDWWLMLIVFGAMGFPVVMGILEKNYLISGFFAGIMIVIAILFHFTVYKLDGEHLIVGRTKIDIKTIRKVYKTNNPVSSPALSIDRIAICYNKFDEILISPKEREDFIGELLKANPDIVVQI
jgi:hypothetical protein